MSQLIYRGPNMFGVWLPLEEGGKEVFCAQGEPVEVPADLASLLAAEQPASFTIAKASKAKTTIPTDDAGTADKDAD